MSFSTDLDKYLTTPYDDGFDGFADSVIENISDDFYEANEWWFDELNGQLNKWLNKAFYKGRLIPKDVAKIIERAFSIYKIKQ
jgi:hypothetical protein